MRPSLGTEIKKVLITIPLKPEHEEKLKGCLPDAELVFCNSSETERMEAELLLADVAFLSGRIDDRYLRAPRLKWIHVDAAGLDSSASARVLQSGLLVTGSAGRSTPALVEHVLFFMLNQAYKIRNILDAQLIHSWGYEGQEQTRALTGQTIGIIGFGHTGRALAQMAGHLGMRVLVYNRSTQAVPEYIEEFYSKEQGDSFMPLLQKSDFVVMAAALTNETYHLLGRAELEQMKRSAFLINLGRGKCIDESALAEALKAGEIAGAGLDTFEQEPLPADSELWRMKQVLVTPHFTPPCPAKTGRSLEIIMENIKRFQAGQPLLNRLTAADVFDVLG